MTKEQYLCQRDRLKAQMELACRCRLHRVFEARKRDLMYLITTNTDIGKDPYIYMENQDLLRMEVPNNPPTENIVADGSIGVSATMTPDDYRRAERHLDEVVRKNHEKFLKAQRAKQHANPWRHTTTDNERP